MAADGLHDTGEEWAQKVLYRQDLINSRDAQIKVGLYNDGSDSLTDSDDVEAITTEPSGGSYARQQVSLDSGDVVLSVNNGNLEAELTEDGDDVSFDVTNNGQKIDAFFVTVTFQSDIVNSETSQNTHLLTSATLAGGDRDLSDNTKVHLTANVSMD